ncbi:MAG: trypsin-like serine protease [Alphaproteobacteria bacterium]|nr:trypsin-like serine protease [Alphaproteobacteria bacterium]
MKKIIIATILGMASSSAYAGPGVSKMGLGLFEVIGHSIMRRTPSIPRSESTVRMLSTQGHRPTEPIKLEFQHDAIADQKIRFLDRSYERYLRLDRPFKTFKKKEILSTELKDDHTLIVDLKEENEQESLGVGSRRSDEAHSATISSFLYKSFNSLNASFDKQLLVATPHLYPWVIHGHMNMVFSSGVEGRGTATLIGKNRLLTAGNCFYDAEEGGLITEATIYFGRHGNRFLKQANIERFIIHPGYLQNDENYDFAVARISEDIGQELGYASLVVFNDATLKNEMVAVTGYPGAKGFFNTKFNLPSYHMYSITGPIVSHRKHKIYYHIDTHGGQSGAGVWTVSAEDIVQCLAVHTARRREEGTGAVRINDENYRIIADWMGAL